MIRGARFTSRQRANEQFARLGIYSLKARYLLKVIILLLLGIGNDVLSVMAKEIPGPHGSMPQQNSSMADIADTRAQRQEVTGVAFKPRTNGEIRILITLPPEHHLLEGFASQYLVKVYPDAPVLIPEKSRAGKISDTHFYIPFTAGVKGRGTIEVQAVYGYCNDKDKLCIPREAVWKIDFYLDPQKGGEIIGLEDKPEP